ncbi:hypothetical protein K6119_00630 [Paracrocinitomix mangrovi]|uniref:hypothetical protein n=1 Tax=Paracrocinitomix mangrovi TaxID=2862509 RepID=UPI001C8DF883|nr:hypothetical protein [Paracrocinitomix mangrovi]UKN02020.1 hypothetical protein K6119_00630 [Paracrocinitomix mangrovi]
MKAIILMTFVLISGISRADFVDYVSIEFKGKEIFNSYKANSDNIIEINCVEGDTLTVLFRTDWGGEFDSFLEIKNESDSLLYSETYIPKKDKNPGIFNIVLTKQLMNQVLKFSVNYYIKSLVNWQFADVLAKSKE